MCGNSSSASSGEGVPGPASEPLTGPGASEDSEWEKDIDGVLTKFKKEGN